MKAPDKIYLHGYSFDDEPCKSWEREPKVRGMRGYPAEHVEYIRKDLVDDTVETAEDHAYFAGSESMRTKLLEWARDLVQAGIDKPEEAVNILKRLKELI